MTGKPIIRNVSITKNVEVVQPSILANATFDFSRLEMQIFLILVAAAQQDIQEIFRSRPERGGLEVPEFTDDILATFSLRDFPIDMAGHEKRLLEAARRLVSNTIKIKSPDGWKVQSLVSSVEYRRAERLVVMTIRPDIWKMFLNIAPGFSEYELMPALGLSSVHSVRLYLMINTRTTCREYSIDELKKRFMVDNKYAQNRDFIRKVIDVAKKELDEKAPVTFDSFPIKRPGSKEIIGLSIVPKKNPALMDRDIELQKLTHGKVQIGMSLDSTETKWLKEKLEFTSTELNKNFGTFNVAKKMFGEALLDIFIDIYEGMLRHGGDILNRKGYFIKRIQTRVSRAEAHADEPGLFESEN